jgi:long-subunit acyl-CoA synthetase (AMP-forming)
VEATPDAPVAAARPRLRKLLPSEFSVESGELTPSLKPRRRVIEQKYAGVLESFYEPSAPEN